jgi:hypothetical protein
VTDKDEGYRIENYLAGNLSEGEQRELERELLAERHLSLLGGAMPEIERAELRKLLERHVAELEGMLAQPRDEGLETLALDELQERAAALEAEVFDAYAGGELRGEDRAWIERLARSSARVREGLATAAALQDIPPVVPAVHTWRKFSAIAAAALLTTTLWGLYSGWIPGHRKAPPAVSQPAPAILPVIQVISLALPTRSAGVDPHIIRSTTKILEIRLPVPDPLVSTWEVVLTDPDGTPVDRQTLDRHPDQKSLVWKVGVDAIIQEGPYTLKYRGLSGEKEVESRTIEVDLLKEKAQVFPG